MPRSEVDEYGRSEREVEEDKNGLYWYSSYAAQTTLVRVYYMKMKFA